VNTLRKVSPVCPKCNSQNTYDIVPASEMISEYPYDDEFIGSRTVGNCKYYCTDCHHTWKKYRGTKPYEKIKSIYFHIGGFMGPNYQAKIDLQQGLIEPTISDIGYYDEIIPFVDLTEESIAWFRSELYKCDFVNWAEEYNNFDILDGTQWEIRIEYDTYCEIKTGSNHYPPKWTKFCKAVSKLCGTDIY
jgi:hypothetical protein